MEIKIKLKEIIWEITGRCNNKCSYCGSKEIRNSEVQEGTIIAIATKIAEYPPEEIDISGGDPLLVSRSTHEVITQKLKLRRVKVKILVNPHSVSSDNIGILDLYDHIGVSINTKEDLAQFRDKFATKIYGSNKLTIITNFNLHNFFLFDKIAELVLEYDFFWQVQFTMYKDKKESELFGLYNYPEAVERLNQDIAKYPRLKIVVADNANDSPCMAGISSIGLLSNGDVIPCLSMRSWTDIKKTEGNILYAPLRDIWMNGFKENRFDPCLCCKDYCKKSIIKAEDFWKIIGTYPKIDAIPIYGITFPQIDPNRVTVTVYAVMSPPSTVIYSTFSDNSGTLSGAISANGTTTDYEDLFREDDPI